MSIPVEVQVASQREITIYDYALIRDIVIKNVGPPSPQGPAMSHLFEGLPYPHDPDYMYRLRILLDVVPIPEEWAEEDESL